MSDKPKVMDLSRTKPKIKGPRLPIQSPTPTTPISVPFIHASTPPHAPTPVASQPQPEQLGFATAELERLHFADKEYKVFAEDLQEVGHIGVGNYGTVLKMLFKKTDTVMAVKKIPVRDLRQTEKKEIMEIAIVMKAGQFPYIVEFYGCLIRDGDVWICMELMDSSMDKVSELVYNKLKQYIPEDILGKMSVSVVKALHYLKRELKIIHRDVKPSNILFNRKGEFKLCDFGISGRLVDSIAKTMEVGCRPYMAPERIDPRRAEYGYAIQSDVWSFGITLLELALGSFPYGKWTTIFDQLNAVVNGPPPRLPSNERFSNELLDFSAACLTKDDTKRADYAFLEQTAFFKRYETTNVDAASWYNSIQEKVT
ncbi:hypothetical protein EMCRGX_G028570 [Ephydatia muelleri]